MDHAAAAPSDAASLSPRPAATLEEETITLSAVSTLLGQLHRLTTQRYEETETLLSDYLETGCALFALPTGIVSRIEGDAYTILSVHTEDGGLEAGAQFALADTYCAWAVEKGTVIAHATADAGLGHPAYADPKLGAYISAPIWVGGALYGTLNFSGVEARPYAFTKQECEIIDVMAQSIGHFIERQHEEGARRRVEAVLREGEARYKQLVEQANDIIYRADLEGRFTYVNAVAAQRTGYDEDALLGMHYLELIREDAREEAQAFYARQIAEQISNLHFEFPIVTKDGQTVWLGQSVQLIREGGRVVGIQAIARDITVRKQTEATLQRSKDLIDRTSRMAKVGGWKYDAATESVSWTREVHRIHEVPEGYKPTVEEGVQFYAPEARPVIMEAVRRAVEDGVPYDLELEIVTAKGNRRWVRTIGQPQRRGDQTVVLTDTFQDITERKEAELALEKERHFLKGGAEQPARRGGGLRCRRRAYHL